MPPSSPLRRRLLHRVPLRVRHYWKLLVTCGVFLVACAVLFSTVRVTPLVTSASDSHADRATQDITGTTDLFDASVAHRIALTFRDGGYQRLLDEFWKDGEKDFLEADLTIDGTPVPSVGIRLKGNSTLAGLTRNGKARAGGFGQGGPAGARRAGQRNGDGPAGGFPGGPAAGAPDGNPPGGGFPGGGTPNGGVPGGDAPGAGFPGGGVPGGAGGFGQASLKAEEPETLPWLIRFDEFVDGRRYQGHREIAVRVAGMGGGTTVLNEAVSLNLLAAAGQPAQGYAYTSFTVNDRPTTARLVVEHPDEGFADTMGGSGVLYKSLATSQFTDQGDDPTSYADDFKQITMKGSQDLQPVINLIRWVNTSGDADFDRHLADHVDVPAFARYLAAQNLLLNFDDMAGPGRNYYLWHDLSTKKFTVVGWDYNLTFAGSATQGPHDSANMGGRFPQNGGAPPQGFQPPGGMQPPDGFQPPDGMQPRGGDPAGPGGPGGFGGMGGNKLKERFLSSAAFKTVYEEAYRDLYRTFYASATALNTLEGITEVLSTAAGYDETKNGADVEQLRTLIRQRTEHLATDSIITSS
ncbi:CotH kinase family protein [Micromonospora sp. NPDC093277]|uniref:CotH kinase family protein n=1 Tax=Micromonospora sp. NPDC093277 TaxID=3364291 RepID=UPI003801F0BE